MNLKPSKEELKLKKLVENSQKVLITGHRGIDPDAVCSILILTDILKQIYPDKEVFPIIQEIRYEWPINTDELFPGISTIDNRGKDQIDLDNYDLAIACDSSSLERCLPNTKGKTTIAIIDHHNSPPDGSESAFVNEQRSSNSEQIYITARRLWGDKFEISKNTARLIYLGIVMDNGRFLFDKINSDTFAVVSDIYDIAKVNMQKIDKDFSIMTKRTTISLTEALNNRKSEGRMCYSSFSKEFIKDNNLKTEEVTAGGKDYFLSNIIVGNKDYDWGFVVYPSIKEDKWRVSFRSFINTEDVEQYAKALGGGGHKVASAAYLDDIDNEKDGVQKVLDTISQLRDH